MKPLVLALCALPLLGGCADDTPARGPERLDVGVDLSQVEVKSTPPAPAPAPEPAPDGALSSGALAEPPPVPFVPTDELMAILAEADDVDGERDWVVSNCVMCGYMMRSEGDHTTTLANYQVRHCTSSCKQSFERDPGRWLRQIDRPAMEYRTWLEKD